ncbi:MULTISPECIES: MarR family winged helix-turn-helix transcriptional regulator [Bacteria]|uniref:MarR family winged helix-turn-helix transcriptional regulator n=1 Tax=Bacteria TaxID=2 RepID=UPI003C7DD412
MKDVIDSLGPVVQRYQAAVDDFDRETARILGVNRTDQRCIEALVDAGDEGLTPREIADRLALTTGSVTTMLDRLERAGYLTRSRHPSDGRRLLVALTAVARTRVWELIGPHLAESTAAVSARFTAAELDTVRRFLEILTEVQCAHVSGLRGRESFTAPSRSPG